MFKNLFKNQTKNHFLTKFVKFNSITFDTMKTNLKLYMIMLGCKPEGRLTEQHDIFFGIGSSLKNLIPQMNIFWAEAKGKLHIDAWREVTSVDHHTIEIVPRETIISHSEKLFFMNLGGYKKNEFEEYHYKILAVAPTLAQATKRSKATAFFKHYDFKDAVSHLDDKYGLDIDDIYNLDDILTPDVKAKYQLKISKNEIAPADELHIGYVKMSTIKKKTFRY